MLIAFPFCCKIAIALKTSLNVTLLSSLTSLHCIFIYYYMYVCKNNPIPSCLSLIILRNDWYVLPYGGSSSMWRSFSICIVFRRRSPPPQGGEHASSAVSLESPPPALSPSASYVVSHWLCGASRCPEKDTEHLYNVAMMHSNTI